MYRSKAKKLYKTTPSGLKIRPFVFWVSATLILSFVVITIIFIDQASRAFDQIKAGVTGYAGWLLILSVSVFLLFDVYLLFSPFASIRLGGKDAKPEFGRWAWFAMLFSAGMGIGLVFWSVAEPIMHYGAPPRGEPKTIEAARQAMVITTFHWGLHAWGIYALVALALAFFSFNCGLPLTIRSVFFPLFGDRVNGILGDFIDTLAVVATLFGVATSLGLGVTQINAGLGYLFPIPGDNRGVQFLLIAIITAMATTSVVLGLDAGIRRLSEWNMWLALIFLVSFIILGPTLFLLNSFVQNIGDYVGALPALSFWTQAYRPAESWQQDWTIFYWAWWIAWSPFVGMFIARISKGRTIREFLLGVLLVPTLLTFLWLTVFGGTALYHELLVEPGVIVQAVSDDVATALFVLLGQYPGTFILSILAIVIVVTFFVTSSDSGSLVIDIITAGGHTDPPVRQRVFWAVLEGVVAAVLLWGGGLGALQAGSISTGLPFTIVLLLMMFSLHKGLSEYMQRQKGIHAVLPDRPGREVITRADRKSKGAAAEAAVHR